MILSLCLSVPQPIQVLDFDEFRFNHIELKIELLGLLLRHGKPPIQFVESFLELVDAIGCALEHINLNVNLLDALQAKQAGLKLLNLTFFRLFDHSKTSELCG